MRGFALNLLLAVVWALFSGEVSSRELAVGFLVGFLILRLFPHALGAEEYVERSRGFLGFLVFFVRELTVANVQVALMALRREPRLSPVIVTVPLRLRSELSLTLLAAVITLMPGTVAMGLSADRRTLYAHAVGLPDLDAARESILRVERELLRFLPADSVRRPWRPMEELA
ncbi:MAG: Na+/H+ antiporter subunit E [Deinococcus sp.]|uniref:Na+/H+ antiporter subunit E n=1 Tax=Deinococcus sp. TaxID=47478 RepID=UPI0026DB7455|nr:Na+/H+ antiporter subunit E [Deinococcus sp.]MDO4244720.1 Na+/H+ antiporter subunit E [Deinococcus sp.]